MLLKTSTPYDLFRGSALSVLGSHSTGFFSWFLPPLNAPLQPTALQLGMKTVWIFSDHIRDRIRLKGFRSVRIRVQIFNIQYRIRIRILKSHIYDVDIQSYPIRYGWHYPYSNPNPNRNMKTNVISVIFVRMRSVFIPSSSLTGDCTARLERRRPRQLSKERSS